jgi:hypothetical protein
VGATRCRIKRDRRAAAEGWEPLRPRIGFSGFVIAQWSREMPAKSGAQQKAAGAALSAKRGDTPKSKLKGPSKQMADSMSEKELEKMASTKRKGKPEHAAGK